MQAVWIDTDMGFDDLAAILVMQHSPGFRVAGMSLVAGNVPLAVATDNALRAAHGFDWTWPIHQGASQPLLEPLVTAQNILGTDGMQSAGRRLLPAPVGSAVSGSDAVTALAQWLALQAAPAPVLALGPLTNLARLCQQAPDLARKISLLVWMGGSQGPGNHTAAAEFNAAVDPEAVQIVLDAGLALHMVGLDTCRQVSVSIDDVNVLRQAGTPKAELLADLLSGYVAIANGGLPGLRTAMAAGLPTQPMALYDPVAAAALVNPGSLRFEPAHIVVELQGQHTRGMTVVERRVPRKAQANAKVACQAEAPLVRDLVLTALHRACLRRLP